jgi:enamine deaminase RidA (YjgF/YER057c/UK114 family)
MHYNQAVRIGDRVETSGQGGWDDDWNFPEDIETGVPVLGAPKMRVEIRVTAIVGHDG